MGIFSRKKPVTAYRHPGLYLNTVDGKGRGVFCAAALKAGDLLEVAPIMIFGEADTALLGQTLLADYCFNGAILPADIAARAGLAHPAKSFCLVMGLASYCNHLSQPNARRGIENEYHTAFYVLSAARDIAPDTEICIDYGTGWFIAKKLGELAKMRDMQKKTQD